eukprot:TRINITY_DN20491_c0_g1_i1.p1 TRINITY_DN20491_c0_g1~~TRINITY_DN20491_c0_g1_i1.p1  ORF type:complete len:237 (-),score=29.62 TRINITY_DN20491_c0_g1_i1:658-1368(-)
METLTEKITSNTGLSSLSSANLITFLSHNFHTITYKSLFNGLETATTVVNQVIYRTAILNKETKSEFFLTIDIAEKKAKTILLNRRKRFVRRVWKKYPLFAIELIKERYFDYTEDLLIPDLTISKRATKKVKFKKNISSFGLRISQIQKLAGLLKFKDTSEQERNTICNKIVGYSNALKLKTPILLTVRYAGEAREYSFKWNETEDKIKTFVALTKTNQSFSALDLDWSTRFTYGN